jgi:hypothetical protein
MNRAVLVGLVALWSVRAEGVLTGTWKLNLAKSDVPVAVGETIIIGDEIISRNLTNGRESRGKLDGRPYPITGDPMGADTAVARRTESGMLEETRLKGGRPIARFTSRFSADYNSSVLERETFDADGNVQRRSLAKYERVGPAPEGADPRSGRFRKVVTLDDAGSDRARTYQEFSEGLRYLGLGDQWFAPLDGTEHQVPETDDSVAVKRLTTRTYEYTRRKSGKTLYTSRWAVSEDGRSLVVEDRRKSPAGVELVTKLHYDRE